MGDVGDYWNDHKEYARKQKLRRQIEADRTDARIDLPVVCGVDGCNRRFAGDHSLRQHLRDRHGIV